MADQTATKLQTYHRCPQAYYFRARAGTEKFWIFWDCETSHYIPPWSLQLLAPAHASQSHAHLYNQAFRSDRYLFQNSSITLDLATLYLTTKRSRLNINITQYT